MKKSKDYQWLIWVIIITISVLASSCHSNNQQPEIAQTETIVEYPYEWDSVNYTRVISSIGGETTSLNFNIKVTFNEEFIEIVNTEFIEDPIIFIGRWTDKSTFIIDDNKGVVTINLNTGFMTIVYQGDIKEIYTH